MMISVTATDTYLHSYQAIGNSLCLSQLPGGLLPVGSAAFATDVEPVGANYYVFGGQGQGFFNTLYEIQPDSPNRAFRAITVVNNVGARSGHTMTLLGSNVYVFGGWDSTQYFLDILSLDMTTVAEGSGTNPSWRSNPFSGGPHARNGHTAVTWGDSIYVFGGFFHTINGNPSVQCDGPNDGCLWFNDLWRYQPATNQWTMIVYANGEMVPERRTEHSAVVIGHYMYVFGGQVAPCCFSPPQFINGNDLWRYNFHMFTWEHVFYNGVEPPARKGHVAFNVMEKMYIYGGDPLNDMWRYTPGVAKAATSPPTLPIPDEITLAGVRNAVIFNILFTLALLGYHVLQLKSIVAPAAGLSNRLNS